MKGHEYCSFGILLKFFLFAAIKGVIFVREFWTWSLFQCYQLWANVSSQGCQNWHWKTVGGSEVRLTTAINT